MKSKIFLCVMLMCIVFIGCKRKEKQVSTEWNTKAKAEQNKVHNKLLAIEKEQGWELLFDGKSLNGWHLYNNADSTKFGAWQVKDGMLFCDAKNQSKVWGDLVTDKAYEDYEFSFDWQIAARGNSGIFINVQEQPDILNTYHSGPEYQILDTDHMDYGTETKAPGCLYGFQKQINKVQVKETWQWNTSTIKQKDGKVEFYLNGILTAKEDFTTKSWSAQVAASRFGEFPEFGKHTKGKIALQNWYFQVWFRNMKIRTL
ncbi:DUF1080 domain-containing protein [Croceivirga sp. JEA036]|uniref:3-keto-disaccharide hydrolase n=1 Tax=Croceivirga sp. JEA036 TaxID=2721162 RepID=UPI00143A2A27|nr:DUF1080 domain-containing protein [Croceivirga sp. JEA036]NJB37761.1 DUF1080 domain-containing protein [Croceivirga sp. JEA036]